MQVSMLFSLSLSLKEQKGKEEKKTGVFSFLLPPPSAIKFLNTTLLKQIWRGYCFDDLQINSYQACLGHSHGACSEINASFDYLELKDHSLRVE